MSQMEQLKELGIDIEYGLSCCGEEEDFYLEMIEEYVREGTERLEKLSDCYSRGDWKNYSIHAHSLKSTSRMIGAMALGEQAKDLELAAKHSEEDKIHTGHEKLMNQYRTLLNDLKGIVS